MGEVLHIIVAGRVQGVGFRYHVEDAAHRYRVAGWVRNLHTGEVEIMARVTDRSKAPFLAEVKKGPRMALVREMKVRNSPPGRTVHRKGFRCVFEVLPAGGAWPDAA